VGIEPNTYMAIIGGVVGFLCLGVTNLAGAIQEMQELATNLQRVHPASPSTEI
jgi:hypothetical protein